MDLVSTSRSYPPQAGIMLSRKKRRKDFFEEFAKIFRLAIKQRPARLGRSLSLGLSRRGYRGRRMSGI
ncbi:hypothetical protein BQ8482_110182 [Mesorhizobium delmotii]|uniref:Uncharacterized protein n=1 Tax=Mesorhizobium delmotii TaxID=1631247 RepID=A0A2P9AAT8_9HYPH|nr:hypothetical protein BQ8482_110182 [Mesorhizobium delmotii]